MKSVNRFAFDKALELRAKALAAVTVDTTTPAFKLGREAPFVHGSDRPIGQDIAVVLVVESVGAITNETFDFEVLLDDAANMPSPTIVGHVAVNKPGVYAVLVDIDTAVKMAGGNANEFLAVRLNVGGTAPSMAWNAYLAPVRD